MDAEKMQTPDPEKKGPHRLKGEAARAAAAKRWASQPAKEPAERKSHRRTTVEWRRKVQRAAMWAFQTPAVKVARANQQTGETEEVEIPPECPSEIHRLLMLEKIDDHRWFFREVIRPLLGQEKAMDAEKPKTQSEVLGGSLEALERELEECAKGQAGEPGASPTGLEGVWS